MPDFGIFRGFNEKLFGDKLYAGQLPTQLGLIGSEDVGPLLLDFYPNAAAAYSLRRLSRSYSGSAIEVRNSSGTHLDIGFVNNELDTATLLTHCGAGDGTVSKWYDQSGNGYNVTQTTAASQPKIVSGGSTILNGGKPTIDFNGSTQYLFNANNIVDDATSAFITTIFSTTRAQGTQYVLEMPKDTGGSRGFDIRTVGATTILSGLLTENPASSTNATGTFSNASGNLNLVMASFDEAIATNNHQIFGNGALVGQTTNGGTDIHNRNTGINLGVFSNDNKTGYLLGNISEAILYKSNQLSNRTGIETNINNFYSIY